MKKPRKLFRRTGEILLVLSLLLLSWLPCGLTAYGWILHSDHYGDEFAVYGFTMLVLLSLMTLAVLLYFCRCDRIAAALGGISLVPVLCIVAKAVGIAEKYSWMGQSLQSLSKGAADVWRECYWHSATFLLLLILALTRYFSYEEKSKRAEKENAPAPGILGDR